MQETFPVNRFRQENFSVCDRLFLNLKGKAVLPMMTTIRSYVRQSRHTLHRLALDPRVHTLLRWGGGALAGFLLSAASLAAAPQPMVLGLLCAVTGVPAVFLALGGCAGYWFFWGTAGQQGLLWTALGLAASLTLGRGRMARQTPLLLPALAALIVSASGVAFQFWMADTTSIPVYLLRVAMGAGTAWIFAQARESPACGWLTWGAAVLALAQVAPLPWLGLGFLAAGTVAAAGELPAAALAGLALDLAQVTAVPMTGVLCLAHLARLLPGNRRWTAALAPVAAYLMITALAGRWDLLPLPGLLLGGLLGTSLPGLPRAEPKRGEVSSAQVRLEMTAGVLAQTQRLLLEAEDPALDEEALISQAAARACGGCPCRKSCPHQTAAAQLPKELLHRTLTSPEDLGLACRKGGRLLSELTRSQERLRVLRGEREQMRECREAVIQQYQFLAEYLQELSDGLSRRGQCPEARFTPQVATCANRADPDNGDRCLWFAGPECRYYVLLCDGMGTGLGALDEGRTAGNLLRRLLTAGFPPEHALRSLNSLCALRGRAGAVTVDLAEIQLSSGRTTLYKWGAAPSYLVSAVGTEKIGTAGPPPGLSVADGRERVDRLSLRRGETLVLVSDGVGGEDALRCCAAAPGEPPGEVAARFLELGGGRGADDATVAAIRLSAVSMGRS